MIDYQKGIYNDRQPTHPRNYNATLAPRSCKHCKLRPSPSHPNSMHIYSIPPQQDHIYIVMPFHLNVRNIARVSKSAVAVTHPPTHHLIQASIHANAT